MNLITALCLEFFRHQCDSSFRIFFFVLLCWCQKLNYKTSFVECQPLLSLRATKSFISNSGILLCFSHILHQLITSITPIVVFEISMAGLLTQLASQLLASIVQQLRMGHNGLITLPHIRQHRYIPNGMIVTIR